MNRDTSTPIFDADAADRRDLAATFGQMLLTKRDAAALLQLAELIHCGRISPEHDLAALIEAKGRGADAGPAPVLPSWAKLTSHGDLIVDPAEILDWEEIDLNGKQWKILGPRPEDRPPGPFGWLEITEQPPALPSWARLSGRGNLTIDLSQVETTTITAPADRRRLLIGPKVAEVEA